MIWEYFNPLSAAICLQQKTSTDNKLRGHLWMAANVKMSVTRRYLTAWENNLCAKWMAVWLVSTPVHLAACLAWAWSHLAWTRQQWAKVLFTDQSHFARSFHDICIWLWREQFHDANVSVINMVVDLSWFEVEWGWPIEPPSLQSARHAWPHRVLDQLYQFLQQELQAIPHVTLRTLAASLWQWCDTYYTAACPLQLSLAYILANGAHTIFTILVWSMTFLIFENVGNVIQIWKGFCWNDW